LRQKTRIHAHRISTFTLRRCTFLSFTGVLLRQLLLRFQALLLRLPGNGAILGGWLCRGEGGANDNVHLADRRVGRALRRGIDLHLAANGVFLAIGAARVGVFRRTGIRTANRRMRLFVRFNLGIALLELTDLRLLLFGKRLPR
jgi:hypothetical protein